MGFVVPALTSYISRSSRALIRHVKGWRQIAIIGLSALAGVTAACLFALVHTPSWYDPPVVVAADRQGVRNNLIAAEQAFTESLRANQGPFIYRVFQDDLNRWISMRREIYPLIDELAPPQLRDPFVRFGEGTITIAGRCEAGGVDVVLSIDLIPSIEDDALLVRADTLRCGSLRAPIGLGDIGLDSPIERDREDTWPGSPRIWGDLVDGLRIESRAWWKNGGMEYRVLDVWVEPGTLNLEIEPLGPHWARNDHSEP